MRACRIALRLAAAAVIAGAAPTATAQGTYLCTSNGRTWSSPGPCPDGATSQRIVIAPRGDSRPPPSPGEGRPVDRPPAPVQSQSARCAEIGETLRTGSARGLSRPALQELYDTYRQQCAEEEARARGLAQEDRNRAREAREREERAARIELDRDKLNRDQCAEMRRILQAKRQRLDAMTPGERADFERFEATWRSRCLP
jgi:hypothetical protein